MKQRPIIVIINKKPYTLYASDKESLSNLSETDRQQLITLLEAIKHLEFPVKSVTEPVAGRVNASTQTVNLHSGDADAIMAQLIMQEELNKKPEITKHSIHKWMAVTAASIILLILFLS